MIISVHIPRTAGSSFRAYLRQKPDINLHEDYGNPIMVPTIIRNGFSIMSRIKLNFNPIPQGTDCLHGHFLPFKYKRYVNQSDVHFITWLRDPADRIRSQFDYCYQSDKNIDKSPFQNKVAKEKWPFDAFINDSRTQNLYSKFLWNFPLENFDFIGIVEHYEPDFQYVCQHFFHDNNPKHIHGNMTTPAAVEDATRDEIRQLNLADYQLYARALKLREKRITSKTKASQQTSSS